MHSSRSESGYKKYDHITKRWSKEEVGREKTGIAGYENNVSKTKKKGKKERRGKGTQITHLRGDLSGYKKLGGED